PERLAVSPQSREQRPVGLQRPRTVRRALFDARQRARESPHGVEGDPLLTGRLRFPFHAREVVVATARRLFSRALERSLEIDGLQTTGPVVEGSAIGLRRFLAC